jgi:hypothetical protein
MRFTLRLLVLAGALLAQSALASPWDAVGRLGLQAPMQQRPGPDQFQRAPDRDFRRQEAPADRQSRNEQRMSDEQRRNLHRDLDRANREIYKGRR